MPPDVQWVQTRLHFHKNINHPIYAQCISDGTQRRNMIKASFLFQTVFFQKHKTWSYPIINSKCRNLQSHWDYVHCTIQQTGNKLLLLIVFYLRVCWLLFSNEKREKFHRMKFKDVCFQHWTVTVSTNLPIKNFQMQSVMQGKNSWHA